MQEGSDFVVDAQGAVARVIERQAESGGAERLLIEAPGGRRFLVPAEVLTLGADGRYHATLDFSALERALAERDVAQHTIPVVEERVRVERERSDTGRVRIHKTIHERTETVNEPILREKVEVERVPMNRPLEGPVESHYEGDTLVIPVVEEVIEVRKRLVLREEVRVTKRRIREAHEEEVTLRSEDVDVERTGAEDPAP
jgi:uncharacterized protein (TIGR02271 family)